LIAALDKIESLNPRAAGLPFNVAQLYMRMAEGIREGKSVSPDFDVAVKRHQLLDAIQKASDTGIRQIF
jgi:predicted dehydrogenase